MSHCYRVELSVNKQEDGLWRVEAPSLDNCLVDAETLEQDLSEIQEVIAMTLEFYKREGWEVPQKMAVDKKLPTTVVIPVVMEEYSDTIICNRSATKTPAKA